MLRNALRTSLLLVFALLAAGLRAQAQAPPLLFEVASIKPVLRDHDHPFNPRHFWAHVSGSRASYWSMTPAQLFTYAYDVESIQVRAPDSANTDYYDIEATLPDGAGKGADRQMLQALLKERFGLTFHQEKKDLEVYVLTLGKHPEKLIPSPEPVASDPDAPLKPGERFIGEGDRRARQSTTPEGASKVDRGKDGTFTIKSDIERWTQRFEDSRITMEHLAGMLSPCLGSGPHKVVDETGKQGFYQVAYDCPLPGNPPQRRGDAATAAGALPPDPEGSSLFGSLEATGLHLQKRKVPMDVYVIDHLTKPTEN